MNEVLYISVILPLRLEWEPCYAVAKEVKVEVGDRVKVRFGAKEYVGVVSAVDITPEIDPKRILPVVSIETDLEKIYQEEIRLWRYIAEYYMCSIGEVYKAAYPALKITFEEARATAFKTARERREKILRIMEKRIAKIEERLGKKEEQLKTAKDGTKKKIALEEGAAKIRKELETAKAALEAARAGKAALEGEESNMNVSADAKGVDHTTRLTLSKAQEKAYSEVKAGFSAGKPVMLHGVTGSGKTEIYIRLAQETISKGKNVLYLVPEIALSRQLEDRLEEHFGERLLVFHSGITAASRRNTAECIRNSKEGYITLGTRSALFLPHHDIGLIIVDEEHDSSYKQDSPAPRYNGRDTALMLSQIQGSNIILGSATPSLEEAYNCECGKHVLVELNERYHGSEDADIEIIDTKAERKKRGMVGSFSRKLIEHIKRTLAEAGQVMILRSRRAWAPALQCEECGELAKCPHCNVSMSLHRSGDMICHYCGHRMRHTGTCPKCNGLLKQLGAGTQKIEEEAAALFPEARVARLDSDTAQSKSYETKTIKAFAKGEIDILVGTQILTKGFDFSRLSLVAVIAADTLLGLQDFRADEKALQLLEQFRGRCGRRGSKGMFVIQTSQPEHPIYQKLINKEANPQNNTLLHERKTFNFPPYSRIIEITIRDRFEDRAERMARSLADILKIHFGMRPGAISLPGSPVTGPYAPAVGKVADQHIRCIRISLRKDRQLKAGKQAVADIVRKFENNGKYADHIVIDVDPA